MEAALSRRPEFFLILIMIFLFPISIFSTTIHVPTDQPTIQAGIDASVDGDSVIVASGTFIGEGNSNISFRGKDIVVISQYGPWTTEIIGDYQDPGFIFVDNEPPTAELIGFSISNYRQGIICKNEALPNIKWCFLEENAADSGGGFYCENSSPTLENCRFINNSGGGFYSKASNPEFLDCIFNENHAKFGGGLFADSLSNVNIKDCSFSDNFALAGGAVASQQYSTININNCQFRDNYIDHANATYNAGGAIAGWYASTLTITDCNIIGNTVLQDGYGAGIYLYNSIGNIEGCVIDSNTSTSPTLGAVGAGLFIVNSEATIRNCSIKYNKANKSGGAVIWHATTEFYNCEFIDNKSITTCGAVYAQENPTTSLFKNCTFSGNFSNQHAGTMSSFISNINIENCIIANSPSGDPIVFSTIGSDPPEYGDDIISPSRLELFESDLESTFETGATSSSYILNISCTDIIGNSDGDWVGDIADYANINGNFSEYPIFCNPLDYDFNLHTISPCAPENNSCGELIGAFDVGCENNRIWYVTVDGDDNSGDGSEENPFGTIQHAITSSSDGDVVLVNDGTYTGDGNRDISNGSRNILVSSINGPEKTIIDCQASSSDRHRGFHISYLNDNFSAIKGFTIKNGYATDGGGIYCRRTNVRLINNIIENNQASYGGGIYCEESGPKIINNVISNNRSISGGGIQAYDCIDLVIADNEVANNHAENGGGLFVTSSSAHIHNNLISGNEAQSAGSPYDQGGGILLGGDDYVISNNIIIENIADFGSAIVCQNFYWEPAILNNNTISANINIEDNGKGVIHSYRLGMELLNNLIAFNSGIALVSEENQPTINCSNIYGNAGGDWVGEIANQVGINGNFSVNPLFCDTANENYHISQYSICTPDNSNCGVLIGALDPQCSIKYPCGDMNNDEIADINDIIYLIEYYFANGPAPFISISGDVNCDGQTGMTDIVILNSFLFNNGNLNCCQ